LDVPKSPLRPRPRRWRSNERENLMEITQQYYSTFHVAESTTLKRQFSSRCCSVNFNEQPSSP